MRQGGDVVGGVGLAVAAIALEAITLQRQPTVASVLSGVATLGRRPTRSVTLTGAAGAARTSRYQGTVRALAAR